MKFLFVVPPLVGHINPTVALGAELSARGHEVAWAGMGDYVRALAGDDVTVYECAVRELGERPPELRGAAALKFLWESFQLPLADSMADGVHAAITEFRPDVVVADQQAIAGALVAERLGVPWVTSATTSGELVNVLDGMPKVKDWLLERIAELRARIGDPSSTVDPRYSPYLVLAFTSAELVGDTLRPELTVRFVGPSVGARPSTVDFPWDWLAGRTPTVLISLGTANAEVGGRFLRACADAVAERAGRLRAVLVDPLGEVATTEHVLSLPRVPQLELLSTMDAVVSHAGHNTVCETLAHGTPLVLAPIRDDQPVIADQVVAAGAGVRVRFNRAGPEAIGAALDTVLREPGYRAAAERLAASLHAAGGVAAAADELLALSAEREGAMP